MGIDEGNYEQRWLKRKEVYGQLNTSMDPAESYYRFMTNQKLKKELLDFYSKERLSPVLGDARFIKALPSERNDEEVARVDRAHFSVTMEQVLSAVSDEFEIQQNNLLIVKKGRGIRNLPRQVAMYLLQHHADYRLKDIAGIFNLAHYGGVSSAIRFVERNMKSNSDLHATINNIINRLDP